MDKKKANKIIANIVRMHANKQYMEGLGKQVTRNGVEEAIARTNCTAGNKLSGKSPLDIWEFIQVCRYYNVDASVVFADIINQVH